MQKIVGALVALSALLALASCTSGGNEEGAATLEGGAIGGGQSTGTSRRAFLSGGGEKAVGAQAEAASLPQIGPQVVQTASLRLSVREGRFDETVDEARSVAAGLGGFVVSSTASQGTAQRLVRGTLVLRIPAKSYAEVLKSVGALGIVEAQTENGQDVSQEYVDLRARIRQLQAVEAQLLELLDRADTVGAALAVQQQLSQVQLELEQARGRLQYLDDQVAFATISLAIHERLVPVAAKDDGFGIVAAWSKAAHAFLTVVGWTFVVLATAAPILLVLALAFLLGRGAVRRLVSSLPRRTA